MLDSTGTVIAMQFLTQPGSSYVNERLPVFAIKKQLSTVWKWVQLVPFWNLITGSDRGVHALLQGTDEGGKINLCSDISRSSILDGSPIQCRGEPLPLSSVMYQLNTSAWAGKMLYTCMLNEGCLCVSGRVRQSSGSSLDVLAKTCPARCQEHANK